MVILGLSDGVDAAAALVVDGDLVALELESRHDRVSRSRGFPWGAIDAVLEEAGIGPDQVEQVVLAGQFSPPLLLRRFPGLRRAARDAFSPAVDFGVFMQAMMRQSGFGAFEADRAAEWLEGRLRSNGFSPRRVLVADIHKSLAEAAYRTQARDEVLVVTLHPMGDGVACAVHHGADGQLDRVWTQKGFSTLHVHLARCATAMGFDPLVDVRRIWAVAGAGVPDPHLVERLATELRAEGPRLSRRGYPFPESPDAGLYRDLARADRATAAASVLYNLCSTVQDFVRYHLREVDTSHVALGGAIFENPRLVAAIAEMPEVSSVWVPPEAGGGALAVGSALALGGIAPSRLPSSGLGRQYHRRQYERALSVAGLRPVLSTDEAEAASEVLCRGGMLARFQGRSGLGGHGGATRSVLVRADDRDAVERARRALGRPADEEVVAVWADGLLPGGLRFMEKWKDAAGFAVVAGQADEQLARSIAGVQMADGRVLSHRVDAESDAGLYAILRAVHRREGVTALACFPLAEGQEPPVAVPGDALRVWRRSGAEAMLLGPFWVRAEAA